MEIMNNFRQTSYNEAKAGAYYSRLSECMSMGEMFEFPEEPCYCIDPTCGDMSALLAVTKNAPNRKLFGVEINSGTCQKLKRLKEEGSIEDYLCADFLYDTAISKNAFSFIYCNPPYLDDKSDVGANERVELQVFKLATEKLKLGGIFVLVVPDYRFFDEKSLFVRNWMMNYETISFYKFRSGEYERFKQGIFIGKRKNKTSVPNREETERFIETYKTLAELPEHPTERIVVPSGEDFRNFHLKKFEPQIAVDYIKKNGIPSSLLKRGNVLITQPEYSGITLKRPPIPLKKDSEYLLLTSGFGGGLVGNEDEGTAHLFRAVAEVIESESVPDDSMELDVDEEDDDNTKNKPRIIVTTHTQVQMRVLENDGTLTLLE